MQICCSDELKQVVTSDLRKLLGAEGEPTFVKYGINMIFTLHLAVYATSMWSLCSYGFNILNGSHVYWSKAFPLYGRNYGSVLEAIDKMEKDLPGFFYAGKLWVNNYNWLRNVQS